MSQTSENLRFLLWRRGTPHASWTSWTAETCDCSVQRAHDLLWGEDPQPSEILALSKALAVAEEDLTFGSLLEGSKTNVIRENLRRLLSEAGHGSKKALAAAMDVHPTTVSRWLAGDQKPPQNTWRHLCGYFGLHPDTDLSKANVFLDPRPLGDRTRKEWLHAQVDALDPEEMSAFFPALERLLEPRKPR